MVDHIVEKNIRFSESSIWTSQKKYYDTKGIAAWDEDVPFYITSNPFIANQYALVLIRFMQDWILKNPDATAHPFYILELGSGTGQFSFYVLKALVSLKKQLALEHIVFRYIMSDMNDHSFSFWKNHAALRSFIDAGVLDFAVYDLYRSDAITLHQIEKKIQPQNPLLVIANYLFDSIATDVFGVNDGKLLESRVTVKADAAYIKDKVITHWKKATIEYHDQVIQKPYYHNAFDDILFQYADTLVDTHFQFPIASLQALQNLQHIAKAPMLLLTSDKAYGALEELDYCEYPELDFHGSISVMVNYHAIGEFAKSTGGEVYLQSCRENILTGVFCFGFDCLALHECRFAIHQLINTVSPSDYFLLYENVTKHYKKSTLAEITAFLHLSDWDPGLFDTLCEHIGTLADKADPDVLSQLTEGMSKVASHFYYLPSATDTLFNIAVFFQHIAKFETALSYYQQSLHHFGDSDITYFNMAMCYESLDQGAMALTCLEKALQYNPKATDVKQWIKKLKKA